MHDVYKLKDMLCEELEEYGRKGEVTANSLEVIDKLAHAIKNIDKILESKEEEESGYSSAGRYYYDDRMGGSGMRTSYARDGRGGSGGYSSARGGRGRGSNARRDSMGRYSSRDGYSMADSDMSEMIDEMRDMMNDLPEHKKMEVQKFIDKMESM